MTKYKKLCELLRNGEADAVENAVSDALAEGYEPQEILNDGLIAPLNELGQSFQDGEVYVPELLLASEAMKKGVERLKPFLIETDIKKLGKCLFCTVEGDVHDIGKNIVILFLESVGFEVVDLGTDVDKDDIVDAIANDDEICILGMSAMLTTTMYSMQDVIEEISNAGLRDRIKIMIGGAPINDEFARKIGADGYSANAPQAVELARKLIEK